MSLRRFFAAAAAAATVVAVSQGRVKVEWPQKTMAASSLWTEKPAASGAKGSPSVDAAAMNRVFTELASSLSPTVVNIYTKTRIASPRYNGMQGDDLFRFFFGNPFGGGGPGMSEPPAREAQALGSGFVINDDGIIITNSHVVRMGRRNADSIMVKFLSDSEISQGHPAAILGVDEATDVAVLKLKEKKRDLAVAPLGDSDRTKVGEWVIAIGNPYGHTNSVTKGIVSAVGRSLDESNSRADFLQTDASINPGNSGGPLFNLYGEVIGINTAIDARAQGIGFAIPINTAKNVIRQLIERGEVSSGWIGVTITELTPQLARSLRLPDDTVGVVIQDPIPGEPAAKAGLQPYDVVTAVNDRPVRTTRDFARLVANTPVGAKANIRFLRDGKSLGLAVTVSKRRSDQEMAQDPSLGARPRGVPPAANDSAGRVGLGLAELTPQIRRQLRIDPSVKGVLVGQVEPGSLASEAGVEPGDIITEVNRKPVRTAGEASAAFKSRGDNFLLKIQRGTASMIILLDMQGIEE